MSDLDEAVKRLLGVSGIECHGVGVEDSAYHVGSCRYCSILAAVAREVAEGKLATVVDIESYSPNPIAVTDWQTVHRFRNRLKLLRERLEKEAGDGG